MGIGEKTSNKETMKPLSDKKLERLIDINDAFSRKLQLALDEGRGILANLSCKKVNKLLDFSDTFDRWLDTEDVGNIQLFREYDNLDKIYVPAPIRDICSKLRK